MWGKNRRKKVRRNVFYIDTNIVTKKWGENARNNFSINTRIVREKNVGKKVVRKSAKKRFYIHTNIVTKKWEKKTSEIHFSRNTNSASYSCWEKNRRKNVWKNVFYIHTIIVTKKWGKKRAK